MRAFNETHNHDISRVCNDTLLAKSNSIVFTVTKEAFLSFMINSNMNAVLDGLLV